VKILSLEASSAMVSLAVSEHDRLVTSHRFLAPRGRGAEIFLTLENLRPAWIDVDRIAVGVKLALGIHFHFLEQCLQLR
jgi:hypothetical protein